MNYREIGDVFTLKVKMKPNKSHSNIKKFRDFLIEDFKNAHSVNVEYGLFIFSIECDDFTDAAKIETYLATN